MRSLGHVTFIIALLAFAGWLAFRQLAPKPKPKPEIEVRVRDGIEADADRSRFERLKKLSEEYTADGGGRALSGSESDRLEADNDNSLGQLDILLSNYEREIVNLRDGEFEHLARYALSLEEQMALRDSGHIEIQANLVTLLGNAVDFESIPGTKEFVERQKIAWTYGMDAYRAINFLEQNQYGRLLEWEEILSEIERPGFDQLRASFPVEQVSVPDERLAELYKRVLDARDDPALPAFEPLSKSLSTP